MGKIAVTTCIDTGPVESLKIMMDCAGYELHTLNEPLITHFKKMGLDGIYRSRQTQHREGVEPHIEMPQADVNTLRYADLFIDLKAQRNKSQIVLAFPNLKDKYMWYRINGGEPCHIPRKGDEINLPCPILTPNLWYRIERGWPFYHKDDSGKYTPYVHNYETPWNGRSYSMYPPFMRFFDYKDYNGRMGETVSKHMPVYERPMCLVHNIKGWGFGDWIEGASEMGIKMHGQDALDGVLDHREIPSRLSKALAYVHFKTNDAPGYSLYEALSAGCPCIVSQRLIIKNRMEELFIDNQTCLVYDHCDPIKVHHPHSPQEISDGLKLIQEHLVTLSNQHVNKRIGNAGREQLMKLMWSESRDGESFKEWMRGHYG